ncbi:uncharacterized protein LOC9653837 [Selaginella moellendorffii]|nr:uncharacterized protein LOC9653837 [Selaginella moellendorffii]|eukprot:XP_024539152.1 uncharacterized protein LOC9653837 [Selaginella moellendorffii]
MGCSSSKNGSAPRADQGWNLPLVRSLSRSWSMPPVSSMSFSNCSSDHRQSSYGAALHRYERSADFSQEIEEEEEGVEDPGEVINPSKPRVRESDSWEIVDETALCSSSIAKPRKRARTYSKSVSLPHSSLSRSSEFQGLVAGLPLVLEEKSPNASLLRKSGEKIGRSPPLLSPSVLSPGVKKGLFYGAWLAEGDKESPRSVEDWQSKGEIAGSSPPSSLEDWYIVGPRKMERLEAIVAKSTGSGGGNCLRDKTNLADRHCDLSHLRDFKQRREEELLERFDRKCPPGGENRVVLYVTSLQGIRKTHELCRAVRTILEVNFARIDERDVAMHAEFRRELRDLVGAAPVPRLFIKGRHIGGGEEVMALNESGVLRELLEGIPKERVKRSCEGCGGARFIPCVECGGSCKLLVAGGGGDGGGQGIVRCWDCNENGLVRCPICY